jgi:hypothetical protein
MLTGKGKKKLVSTEEKKGNGGWGEGRILENPLVSI